ncbi:MAG: cytochrome c [Verrucomicrobia bacterium]|nr:cytochrome c [Verrucomicrobiota bacterium]MBV8483727.1 cytochrome c [Verrucomicrobiota bacterium]
MRITSVLLVFVALGSGFASENGLPRSNEGLWRSIVMAAALSPFRPFAVSPTRDSGFRLFDQAGQADGQKVFQTRCFVCHGRDGKGDGPSAVGLAEKPQDLTDANWQRSTSDDRIRSVIQGGGAAIGKTGAMPPNPDLTQEQIQGLVAFVRSLAVH